MSEQHYPHIVVGGGISGLSAAHYAAQAGVDTLLLEREGRLGGCMQTHTFTQLGGFWVEAGSHSCFNSYGNLLQIMERLDLLGKTTAKAKQGYRLWRDGERKSVLSALHVPELLLSLPRLKMDLLKIPKHWLPCGSHYRTFNFILFMIGRTKQTCIVLQTYN